MPDCDQAGTVDVEGDGYFKAEGYPVDQTQEEPWIPELNLNL
jgi:hypothetical protein